MKYISCIINHPGEHSDIIRFNIGPDELASMINDLDQTFKRIM